MQVSLKICQLGAESFRADGQTGRSLIIALRNFANKIKKKHIRTFGYKSYVFEHTDCKA